MVLLKCLSYANLSKCFNFKALLNLLQLYAQMYYLRQRLPEHIQALPLDASHENPTLPESPMDEDRARTSKGLYQVYQDSKPKDGSHDRLKNPYRKIRDFLLCQLTSAMWAAGGFEGYHG
jgi:hypothetical protein